MTSQLFRSRKANVKVSSNRWVAYATAGAATAVAGASTAEASIHYSGVINAVFSAPPGGSQTQHFALAGGASFTPLHVATSGGAEGIAAIGFHGVATAMFNGFHGGGGSYPYVSRFGAGVNPATHAFIGVTNAFFPGFGTLAFRGGYGNDQWLAAGTGFVGFRFNNGAGVQYGWVRLTMNGSPLNSFTMVDYAWGDVGDAIVTGQIPEPGSLALLAVGAVGLLAWRRQRAKADKAA